MIRCEAIVHSDWVIVSFIAFAVSSLVRQTELTRVATSARSLVVAAGILLTTLGIGALMGWMGFTLVARKVCGGGSGSFDSGADGGFGVGD